VKSRARGKAEHSLGTSKFWSLAAQAAAIVVAVALVYLPALRAGFVWDDEQLITRNPLLRTFSGLVEIWSGGRTADYFPITNTVFWIEFHLFGENATGYHALNIFLQAANALLVWLVLGRLGIPCAWLAGLIFGIHPVHAESVAWISELKNLLAMFFASLSIFCFFEGQDKNRFFSGRLAYFTSLVLFSLALLSKTQTVFLPVTLLLCAWWRSNRRTAASARREMIRSWPFFLTAAVFSLVTIWFQNRGIGEEEIVTGSLARRLVNAGMAVWWYAGKVFAPVQLMAIYPPWRFGSPRLLEWLPLVGLIILVSVLWLRRSYGAGGAFFAVSSFTIALLPILGFVRMAYLRSGTLVADHFQYFGDVSLIALFSAGIYVTAPSLQREIKIATVFLGILLLGAMGSYTWCRANAFRSEETLWHDNLSKNPAAWQAYARLGERLFREEKYAEAAEHLERAVGLKPELSENRNLLGLTFCRLNRFEQGIAQYREALRLKEARSPGGDNSGVATIRTNLANALTVTANNLTDSASFISDQAMQRYEEAIGEYEKALELEPQQPAIHRNLGILLARLGRYDEAVMHLRATLQMVPDEPLARETLNAIETQRQ
jgi:protein O-mannosyl-transferase